MLRALKRCRPLGPRDPSRHSKCRAEPNRDRGATPSHRTSCYGRTGPPKTVIGGAPLAFTRVPSAHPDHLPMRVEPSAPALGGRGLARLDPGLRVSRLGRYWNLDAAPSPRRVKLGCSDRPRQLTRVSSLRSLQGGIRRPPIKRRFELQVEVEGTPPPGCAGCGRVCGSARSGSGRARAVRAGDPWSGGSRPGQRGPPVAVQRAWRPLSRGLRGFHRDG